MKSNREKIFPSWNSISKGLVVIKVHVSRFRKKCMSQYSILAIENIWTWTVLKGKKPTVWKFNQDKRDLFLMTFRLRGQDFFLQSRAREPASILAGKRYSRRHSTTSSFFFNKNINCVYFSGEKMHKEAFRGVDFFENMATPPAPLPFFSFFFRLASNAFPDIGSAGRIDKKTD